MQARLRQLTAKPKKSIFLHPLPSDIDSSMDDSGPPEFTPVPLRTRRDGWTAERQMLFIMALRRTRSIGLAAAVAEMSRESAYRLRARPGAESFAAAWDAALARPEHPPASEPARNRLLDPVEVPIMCGSKQIGIRRVYDRRAFFNVLRAHIARNGLLLRR